jgi:hypothetical protein
VAPLDSTAGFGLQALWLCDMGSNETRPQATSHATPLAAWLPFPSPPPLRARTNDALWLATSIGHSA